MWGVLGREKHKIFLLITKNGSDFLPDLREKLN